MEDTELRQQFQSINQKFESMTTLIVNVKESLEREIGGVRADVGSLGERIDRMDVRLSKIAAGAGYVTRLVEWSEKQDRFQLDILERVQKFETRVDKIQKNGQ